MKAERKNEVHLKTSRVPGLEGIEIILRCENSVVEEDDCDSEESVGKYKFEGQLEKQMKNERKDPISKVEKENGVDIGALLKKFKQKCAIVEESSCELVPRSPMRTQECHHCCKPYQYPHSTSRAYGGVTRVVEEDRTYTRRSFSGSQTPNSVSENGFANDIDLCDVSRWLNLCKRDPKILNDFVESCKSELTNREISNVRRMTTRSVCSNVSSQYTSPAQSPSEQNLTSPESVNYDDSSLYFSKSPNIQTKFYSIDISNKSVSSDEEKGKSPRTTAGERTFFDSNQVNMLTPNIGVSETELSQNSTTNSNSTTTSFPNIGTVMLNLVEGPYESTIDLNQFANVCDTYAENGSSGSGSPEEQTPMTLERDSLNKKLDPKAKENAWARISQLNIDLLGKGDNEGDTQLMILLVSEKVTLEYVYVIVERLLKEHPEYLSCRNELNQDALYLASFKLVWEPLVASYIAEALVRGKQDVNMKYDNGNTLLHCLAKKGDSHVRVLERLVKLRHPNRSPVFDVNKKNNRGFTPLHMACEVHKREVVHTYQTVRVLVENGADCTAKDYKDENTPLHTLVNESCDAELLRILLESANRVGSKEGPVPTTVPNRQGNTALHLACGRNTLRLNHQKDVIEVLLRHGAMIQLKNINGFVPSVLVDSTRKQEIKVILHSYRQK